MKRKLLLLLCALLATVGTWAETDVTSTYLTNADFSNDKTGWTGIKDDSGTNKNTSFVLVNNSTFGKGGNDKNAEMWIAQNQTLGAGDINQTLSNVPAGVYRLRVNVRSDLKFYLYASIDNVEQHRYSETGTNGVEEFSLLFVVKTTSNVKIGLKHNGASVNTYNWIAVDDFKLYREGDLGSAVEVTNQILNWDFLNCDGGWGVETNFPGWTVYNPNSGNAWAHNVSGVATAVEYYKDPATQGSFDYYQAIAGLPRGKYTLSASMWHTQGAVSGECGVYGTSSNGSVFAGVTDDCGDTDLHTYSTSGVLVTDGALRVGVKNTATMNAKWFGVDWIKLYYHGNNVEYYSPATFTSGSSTVADTWYEFTVTNAGIYKIASTNAATVYYTQNASDDADETASMAIAASGSGLVTLTAGKLYFKSDAASTITIAPFVMDGTYYLYDATNKLFLGRGSTHGTRAAVDKYGVPFTWTSTPGYISFVDWSNTCMFFDQNDHTDCWLYTDGGDTWGDNRLMTFTDAGDGKVYLQDKAKAVYVKHDNNVLTIPTTSAAEATKWTLMSVAEHNDIVSSYPAENINHVITAAELGDKTTADDFETYLSTYYDANDMTDKIGTAKFGDDAGDWTWSQVENRSGVGGYRYETAWQWQRAGSYTQTVDDANLPAGIYKLEMGGFDRHATEALDITFATNYGSLCSSYLKANNEQVRMKAWADVEGRPTTDVAQASSINNGGAENVVYLYLDGSTDLDITVCKQSYLDQCYFNFGNFRLTRYTLKNASAEDYTALNTAISTAEAKFGFEEGDCAPYNNLGVFTLLNAAKEIDPEEDNLKYVVHEATDALNDFEWSVNATELNAFYGGNFTKYETVHNDGDNRDEDYPYGWNLYHGDKNRSRIMGGTEGDSNAGLDATTSGKALLLKFNATYGESEGYNMPLKAGKIYRITFKHGRWAEAHPRLTDVVMTDPNGTPITLAPAFQATNNDCQTTTGNWETYTGYFASTTAGNYKLNLTKQGGDSQMQIAIGDIDLRTAEALPLTDVAGTTYAPGTYPSVSLSRTIKGDVINTLVLPFSMTQSQVESVFGAESRVYEVKSYNSENKNITFKVSGGITANQPCLLKAANAGNTHEISNVEVVSEVASPTAEAVDGVSLVGSYEPSIFIPINNYVISGGNAYLVDQTNYVNLRRTRAYIHIAGDSGARLAIKFEDDGFTGINAIEATEAEADAPKDGKYLIDGKIVIVKNGVKYCTNGQKLN